jgi:DNA-binding NarL/FixJ family response regulator
MRYRALEEIAGRIERKHVPFSDLMPWRVRRILLVSSLYDSFTFQEDGNLGEMLFSEYQELNLSSAPSIIRVSTAEEAEREVVDSSPDLVITMPRVGDMDVFDFGLRVRERRPELPVVLLAYDTRELAVLKERAERGAVDRFFVWLGDARVFLAIIKWAEDLANCPHDAELAGVRRLLLIEDSIRFYSAYLPMLYSEIMIQTQALMAEGVNRMQQLMRMRARPKVLLASTYEEAEKLYRASSDNLLGVISDAAFPKGGTTDPAAGLDFARAIRADAPDMPVLIQSSDADLRSAAEDLGTVFCLKSSPTLLHDVRGFMREQLGFGDFIFKDSGGAEIARADDLRSLVEALRTVPSDSLVMHANRNDFSTWFMARTEFDLAKALRPRTASEFADAEDLREFLLSAIRNYRSKARAGLVEAFSSETFEPEVSFTRLGSGSLGGKGRGLAFVNSLLNAYEIEDHIPGVAIRVPKSAVVATGVFDEFMEETGLTTLAIEEESDVRIRDAFLGAPFPGGTCEELRSFLSKVDYPLAVRSSSLFEDSSFQPFAGVYQTYMIPNSHPDLDVRLDELCRAIRLVYASMYSSDSKAYIESTPNRLEEEKMGVIIQQIAGRRYGNYAYPNLAGVARSYDFYPVKGMKAEDGIASVALGLGRMVVEGGRVVRFSPTHPNRLFQFSSTEAYLSNAQREFYALDLSRPAPVRDPRDLPDANLALLDLETAERHGSLAPVGSTYSPENDRIYEGTGRTGPKLVTMAGVLSGDAFPLADTLRFLLEVGKSGFTCQTEIEFAVNLSEEPGGRHEMAFLQIRPMVFGGTTADIELGEVRPSGAIVISDGALGHGRIGNVSDIVYVRPDTFDRALTSEMALEIGSINGKLSAAGRSYLLIGPGRWGSADPWLGIPVKWGQISRARCIVETEMQDIKVEPSQGTHFFQNITSFGVGYFTVRSEDAGAFLDQEWLDGRPAETETRHIRHVSLPTPVEIVANSRTGNGVVLKPGVSLGGDGQ